MVFSGKNKKTGSVIDGVSFHLTVIQRVIAMLFTRIILCWRILEQFFRFLVTCVRGVG